MVKMPLQSANRTLTCIILAGITFLFCGVAVAKPNDIQLNGLGRPATNAQSDPASVRFRLLTSELALALSSKPLTPAETLGISGFEYFIGFGYADISETESYWQGQPGSPVFEGVRQERKIPKGVLIPSIHLRKGLPLSTEIGVQGNYFASSEMFMVGVDLKVALHESFFRWFPSIAIRGAASTLFGAGDFIISTGEADLLISLPIGIGNMVRIDPYIGFGIMRMDATSDVIDATPYDLRDQGGGPTGSLFTFTRQKLEDNDFTRLVIGAHAQITFIKLIYELDVGTIKYNDTTLQTHTFQIGFDA